MLEQMFKPHSFPEEAGFIKDLRAAGWKVFMRPSDIDLKASPEDLDPEGALYDAPEGEVVDLGSLKLNIWARRDRVRKLADI